MVKKNEVITWEREPEFIKYLQNLNSHEKELLINLAFGSLNTHVDLTLLDKDEEFLGSIACHYRYNGFDLINSGNCATLYLEFDYISALSKKLNNEIEKHNKEVEKYNK